jgi:rhodanese-related sulfurtransferase
MEPKAAYEHHDDVQIVDVRESDEWEAGHIEGAVHIPMGQLNQRQDELADDRQIVTVCRSGSRSGAVADTLNRAGYRAENLEGGMQTRAREGLPFVAEDGREPRVA